MVRHHRPRRPPRRASPLPRTKPASRRFSAASRRGQRMQGWNEERWTELRATYYGMCSRVDHQFGLLGDALRECGRYGGRGHLPVLRPRRLHRRLWTGREDPEHLRRLPDPRAAGGQAAGRRAGDSGRPRSTGGTRGLYGDGVRPHRHRPRLRPLRPQPAATGERHRRRVRARCGLLRRRPAPRRGAGLRAGEHQRRRFPRPVCAAHSAPDPARRAVPQQGDHVPHGDPQVRPAPVRERRALRSGARSGGSSAT